MKREKRAGGRKKSPKNSVVVKFSLVIAVSFILFATVFKVTELILGGKKDSFPKLNITLKEVPIEQIYLDEKGTKYPENTVTFTKNNRSTTFNNVEIKGRGNITWIQPKKPYQLKFSEKAGLLEHIPAKKWLLLADYFDDSHLRNALAFYIQNLLAATYPIEGEHTELYIDDVYYGLYYITEKVEIDKYRVELKDDSGIIVELDNLHNNDESCATHSKNGDCFLIHDSINPDNSSIAIDTFTEKFNQLESAVANRDYYSVSEIIDVDSFAKYFLINEFANNPDAYGSSFFLYTDGDEDKIHADAGWDFDLAFGNQKWEFENIDHSTFLSPYNTTILKSYLSTNTAPRTSSTKHLDRLSPILYDLMDIPEFESRVKEIYQGALSGKGEELLEYIRRQANYIRPAALRDQERWKLKTSFDDEIDYLIDWIAKRYDHFEQTYGANSQEL